MSETATRGITEISMSIDTQGLHRRHDDVMRWWRILHTRNIPFRRPRWGLLLGRVY